MLCCPLLRDGWFKSFPEPLWSIVADLQLVGREGNVD